MKILSTFYLLIFFLTTLVMAQTTYTWFGGDGDWETAANWSPSGIPGHLDTAIIDTGTVTLTKHDSIANLQLGGILQGAANLTVLSEMIWTRGQMAGTGITIIAEGASLYWRAFWEDYLSSSRKVYNYGTAVWDSGYVFIVSSGIFYNYGTFQDRIDRQYYIRGTTNDSKFVNAGTYEKTGTGLSFFWVNVTNSSSFDVQNGQVTFVSTFSSTGSLLGTIDTEILFSGWVYLNGPVISEGAVQFDSYVAEINDEYDVSGKTEFSRGKSTFGPTSSIVNLGNIAPEITREGTLEFNTGSEVVLDSMKINGGSLGGTDDILINKSFDWDGTVSNTSTLGTYQSGATVTIASEAQLLLQSGSNNNVFCQIDNYGTAIYKGYPLEFFDGVDFNNYGTFIDSIGFIARTKSAGCIFSNMGKFIKANDRISDIQVKFENKSSGQLIGLGTIGMAGGFSNEGSIQPGDPVGMLTITDDYTPESSASLEIEIGGTTVGTEYDQFNVNGTVALAGKLSIKLVNDFVPSIDDEYQIMKFTSGSGSFDEYTGLDTGKGVAFEVKISDTDVKLVAVEATPNTPPASFNLISPVDKSTLESMESIEFIWQSSSDAEGDSLFYDLNISGDSFDTTITHLADTSFIFHSQNRLEYNTQYDWTVTVTDGISDVGSPDVFSFTTPQPNNIEIRNGVIPEEFSLAQNYPNPFNPSTIIGYDLPITQHVLLQVFDINGRKISTLVDGLKPAGRHKAVFDAKDMATGIYLYRIETGNLIHVKRMLLIK